MNVNINIETKQYDENKNIDIISTNVQGTMYEKNDAIYIVYKEKERELETTSTIKINKDEISIKKFGSTNSTMKFKVGETDQVKYKTPQGLFIIENATKKLEININKDTIDIHIDYNIKIMELFEGRNVIRIKVIKNN